MKKKTSKFDFAKLSENISKLMEACGIDGAELSKQTGLPSSTICRLRSNAAEFSPNLSSLVPLADFFRVTISQLIGEEPICNEIYGTFKPNKIKKLPIPILSAESILDYLNNANTQNGSFLDIDFPVGDKTFAYLLQGNAMDPQFPDKTLLIVDPELEPENLDYVLVIPTGKKLPIFRQVLVDGDEMYLRALNPAFNECCRMTPESHQLLGVMVQSRRNYKMMESVVELKAVL